MKKINMNTEDIVNVVGTNETFKDVVGEELEVVGVLIRDDVTAVKTKDARIIAGNSAPIKQTIDFLMDAVEDDIADGKIKEEDFLYTMVVAENEGNRGKKFLTIKVM